ncbi:MAG: 30S ribosomal protein S6 [Rubricoccaceae bacterium]|nr:30S ribosomal protein S6 [Rubricoccaceae bacterium]
MADQAIPMYEMMYIVNPVLNDEQTKDIVERVTKYIRENDGDIVEIDEMGSQRLAYPIQKKRNGYYVNLWFRHTDGDFIARFDRVLRINDEIMRHLILRYDAKMMRHFEQQQAERKQAAATAEA